MGLWFHRTKLKKKIQNGSVAVTLDFSARCKLQSALMLVFLNLRNKRARRKLKFHHAKIAAHSSIARQQEFQIRSGQL